MSNPFFDHPILNSPYVRPTRHWELDENGQPTQKILDTRRRAEFITPIPKPKKHKKAAKQEAFVFNKGEGLSTKEQQYDPTSIINEVRGHVDAWRSLPKWQVTAETARLLQHWRHHEFSGVRPFFCQVEAVENAIWLTEVAPQSSNGKRLLDYLASANRDANPELMRVALKLATGEAKRQSWRCSSPGRRSMLCATQEANTQLVARHRPPPGLHSLYFPPRFHHRSLPLSAQKSAADRTVGNHVLSLSPPTVEAAPRSPQHATYPLSHTGAGEHYQLDRSEA
jgi:hypothetical protein